MRLEQNKKRERTETSSEKDARGYRDEPRDQRGSEGQLVLRKEVLPA